MGLADRDVIFLGEMMDDKQGGPLMHRACDQAMFRYIGVKKLLVDQGLDLISSWQAHIDSFGGTMDKCASNYRGLLG